MCENTPKVGEEPFYSYSVSPEAGVALVNLELENLGQTGFKGRRLPLMLRQNPFENCRGVLLTF